MAFKDKLRELRDSQSITQSELAARVGVTTRTLQNYEMGRSYPKNQAVVTKLCFVLGCKPSELFSVEEEFVVEAAEAHGGRGAARAKSIIAQTSALFAGGDLDAEDREAFLRAIMQIYFEANRRAKSDAPQKSE